MLSHEDNELLTRTGRGTPMQECNWFQAMEGGIDSSHISFLHSPLRHDAADITTDMDRVSFGVGAAVATGDRAPRFEVVETDYGALIAARRTEPDGRWHWRVTQYCLPFWTMPPAGAGEKVVQSHIWVPMDDTHVVNWMVTWHTERPLTAEEIQLHVEGKGSHVCDYEPPTSDPYGDVRSASIVLAPGANWVEAVTPLVVVRPDQPLILA